METIYRKDVLKIIDRCFHMYASDYRNEAQESATEMLEEIPNPTPTLEAENKELREMLSEILAGRIRPREYQSEWDKVNQLLNKER